MTTELIVSADACELIPAGEESLSEIAARVSTLLDRQERDAWEVGRLVALARARCERPDCGIPGANPDARFGKWCAENFFTHRDTLYNARRLWATFGERPDCGIPGANPDARFGRWVSQNFGTHASEHLRHARRLWAFPPWPEKRPYRWLKLLKPASARRRRGSRRRRLLNRTVGKGKSGESVWIATVKLIIST